AWTQRVSRGPRTTIDARICSTSSYGASGTMSGPTRMRRSCSADRCTSTPIDTSRSLMISTSMMRGTLRRVNSPSAMRVAAISLRTEFFAPSIGTVPSRGRPGRTTNRSTGSVCPRLALPLLCDEHAQPEGDADEGDAHDLGQRSARAGELALGGRRGEDLTEHDHGARG